METSTGAAKNYKPSNNATQSDSVLEPVKSQNPENDTQILWDLAIRRVTHAKREDAVDVSDELMGLGVSVAARASVLSKTNVGGSEAKAMLAELFAGKVDSPASVEARINSLYAIRDYYAHTGKEINIALLNKALNGLDADGEPKDYSLRHAYEAALAHVHTTLTLSEKRGDFEGTRCVEDTGSAFILNPAIRSLVESHPERYTAITELIANRWITTTAGVLEMLDVSDSNGAMEGAL